MAAPTVAATADLAIPVAGISATADSAVAVASTPIMVTPHAVPAADVTAGRFDAVLTVDVSLYTDPDPAVPCPTNQPERTFPLDFAENLIGRRSQSRGTYPEIPLEDPGVSHRHAKLLLSPSGLTLLELGSTNGTQLNGRPVDAGVPTSVSVGDSISLGCWTRITVRER
jgi:hypothetical protein